MASLKARARCPWVFVALLVTGRSRTHPPSGPHCVSGYAMYLSPPDYGPVSKVWHMSFPSHYHVAFSLPRHLPAERGEGFDHLAISNRRKFRHQATTST